MTSLTLTDIEARYIKELGRPVIDTEEALRMNGLYSDKLFELYETLTDPEEKTELEHEIDYLIQQARAIRHIQLNTLEETA